MKFSKIGSVLLALSLCCSWIQHMPTSAFISDNSVYSLYAVPQSSEEPSALDLGDRSTLISLHGFQYPSYIYLNELVTITCPEDINPDYTCSISDESILSVALESHSYPSTNTVKLYSHAAGTVNIVFETKDYSETIKLTVVSETAVPTEDTRELLTTEHGIIYPSFLYLHETKELILPYDKEQIYNVQILNQCVHVNGVWIGGVELNKGDSLYLGGYCPGTSKNTLSYQDPSGTMVYDTLEVTVYNGVKPGSWFPGDIDLNGIFDFNDEVELWHYLTESAKYPLTPFQLSLADIDNDGEVNARDMYIH